MSDAVQMRIDAIQGQIELEVDAGMEQFSMLESHEGKLLQFVALVTQSVVHQCTVGDMLQCFSYLQHTGAMPGMQSPGPDRIAMLINHFTDVMTLELARRYA